MMIYSADANANYDAWQAAAYGGRLQKLPPIEITKFGDPVRRYMDPASGREMPIYICRCKRIMNMWQDFERDLTIFGCDVCPDMQHAISNQALASIRNPKDIYDHAYRIMVGLETRPIPDPPRPTKAQRGRPWTS